MLRQHWAALAAWEPHDWRLGLGVFVGGEPVGSITLRARDFAVLSEVSTFSWLGLAHHGRGIGTRARAAALALAFDHLGARSATSERWSGAGEPVDVRGLDDCRSCFG